jgi:hypothetical protein
VSCVRSWVYIAQRLCSSACARLLALAVPSPSSVQLLLAAGGDRRAAVAVQQHNSMQLRQPLLGRPNRITAAEFARLHGQVEVADMIDGWTPGSIAAADGADQ